MARNTKGQFVSNGNGRASDGGLYGGLNLIMMNQMRTIVENAVTSRSMLARQLSEPDSRRNIDDECGYLSTSDIDATMLRSFFDRLGVAARVVEILPTETWLSQPSIFEDEDSEAVTEFEEAWQDLANAIRSNSWFQDEEGNPIWEYLLRADILSGIGSFGALLIGVDDGKELRDPLTISKDPSTNSSLNLLYLRSFDESLLQITRYEQDMKNPRFGQPVEYLITFSDPNEQTKGGTGLPLASRNVHWTRVIHLADNLLSSEVFGVPRMRPVFNHLQDLRKLYGGSAEMYWRGALPGIFLETHPQLGGDVDVNRVALKDDMEQFMNGLQRYMMLTGMSGKSIAPQVVDPTPQIKQHIEAICIKLGIPMRIFVGSERGELASSQDTGTWNDRLRARQNGYVTPRIIVPFIDRLIGLGVLPVPEGYSVVWPDMEALSDTEKADIAVKRTDAMSKYLGGSVESLMPPMDYLTRELGFTQDEAKAILEAAEEIIEEKQAEAEAQQEEQMKQQQELMKEQAKLQPQQPPQAGQPPGAKSSPLGTKPPVPGRPSAISNFNPSQPRDGEGQWSKVKGGRRPALDDDDNTVTKISIAGKDRKPMKESSGWKRNISEEESRAVEDWADRDHLKIRKELVSGNPSAKSKAFMSAVDKAPNYEGTVYRGFGDSKYANEQMSNISKAGIGGTWTDRAPHSMTVNPEEAIRFSGSNGVLMRVKSRTGADVRAKSNLGEEEVIGRPGTKYKIIAITAAKGRYDRPVVKGRNWEADVKMFVDLEEIK